MPTTDFEKRKEELLIDISNGVTEERELEALFNLFNKLMTKKAAKAKKAQRVNLSVAQSFYSRTRVPSITSLQSVINVTNEEALQELDKMIESWK